MIALLVLSGVTAKEARNYLKRLKDAGGDESKMAPRPDDSEDWKTPKKVAHQKMVEQIQRNG